MRAKRTEIAQVIAPYVATTAEQLSLVRGQLIMIRKKTSTGWWEGELQAKGRRRQIGWFPATYVKVLQGGRNSGRNTPVSGSRVEMSEQILGKFHFTIQGTSLKPEVLLGGFSVVFVYWFGVNSVLKNNNFPILLNLANYKNLLILPTSLTNFQLYLMYC